MEQGSTSRDAEVLSAIVMPNSGETDDEITNLLVELGGQVHQLASGFLSVKASRQALRSIEPRARVEEKSVKQMRR